MTMTITIEHNDVTYHGTLAKIDKTMLGYEDHGVLTAYLHCSWPSGGVGVGGYNLDRYRENEGTRVATAYGLDQLAQMMKTAGVDSWEKLPGRQVIVLFEGDAWGGTAKGIAGTQNGKVLILAEHADQWILEG